MNLSIIEQICLYIPIILGAYISISLMKIPNLSIEVAYVFGSIMAFLTMQLEGVCDYTSLIMVVTLSLCGGAIVGIMSALLAQFAGFSHILSAIITMGLFHGFSLWVLGGSHGTMSHEHNPLRLLLWVPEYPELPMICFLTMVMVIAVALFLRTQLGISCALYGDNINFLKNYRMNESYVVIAGMAVSGALAGLSGYMVAQSNGFTDTTMGVGIPLLCLSSLIIGKSICIHGGVLSLRAPILGIVGYFLLQTILLKLGFDLRYFTSIQAIIVALLLIFSSRFITHQSHQKLLGI